MIWLARLLWGVSIMANIVALMAHDQQGYFRNLLSAASIAIVATIWGVVEIAERT